MKKGFTIILLLTYFQSVFGLGLKEIYCCGKLKAVTVEVTVHENQQCRKEHQHNKCCQTKYHYLKLKDNHLTATGTQLTINPPIIALHIASSLWQQAICSYQSRSLLNSSHSPPIHNGVSIYTYNCVYRI